MQHRSFSLDRGLEKVVTKAVAKAVTKAVAQNKKFLLFLCVSLLIISLLCSCNNNDIDCYYAYFEETAFIFVYKQNQNTLYEIELPLETILLWGKSAGLSSIPIAMRNYVGLSESGLLVGTSQSLQTLRDMLDVMGMDRDGDANSSKRLQTLVENVSLLSKKPLSDNMNTLCGQDVSKALKVIENMTPKTLYYDARGLFSTEDLNFSQRYFTQWLGQVLGGY